MVNSLGISQQRLVRKFFLLSVVSLLVANLLMVNFAFAKRLELNEKQVEKIKIGLDLAKTFGNIVLSEDKLKTVFNTVFSGGETSVDITYGLLVLSAFNEMELIDLVVSQRYKKEADKYFNSILNERSNLLSYYKGIGFDIPKVLSGKITGPIAALTLNTFSITNEAINIFIAFENLRTEKLYDGLWRYLDDRRNNSSHREAWEFARYQMGWAVKSTSRYGVPQLTQNRESQLELQFAQLWDKWGQHTTAFGVTQETRQRFNEEMRGLVAQAIEASALAEKVSSPSLLGNIQSAIANLAESVKRVSAAVAGNVADKMYAITKGFVDYATQLVGKGGAGLVNPLDNEPQQLDVSPVQVRLAQDSVEIKSQQVATFNPDKVRQEIFELRGILTKVKNEIEQEEILKQKLVVKLDLVKQEIPVLNKEEVKLDLVKEEALDLVKDTKLSSAKFCEIDPLKPMALGSVIFQEIAWMGSASSANDEYIKLKNISNSAMSITGWQVQDKDGQIQIAFGEEHNILSQGIFILERTNDDSLSDTKAHVIYTGALNNTNEALYLFDTNCALRDKVVADPDWPAGDSASRKPMKRDNDLSWYTQGGGGPVFSSSSSSSLNAGSPPPTIYPKILISEVQTAGVSSQIEEFVELYNQTQGTVGLTDWYIQKKTQGADSFSTFASKNILSGKTIQAGGYFLVAREGSSFASSADAVTSYSLADNNTLALKNPNGEIVDKVGWGDVQDAENAPAQNPQVGQSLNRIWDAANQTYYDRDNNSIDFVVHNPASPKAQNTEDESPPPEEPPPPSQDTTPPEVTFGAFSSSQSNTSFSLSWAATDSGGEANPSGVQSIFVEYVVVPESAGIFAQYDNNGVWTNWQAGSAGKITLSAQTTSLSIRAQDGVNYAFQVSASDVAGNTSAVVSASTAVTLSKSVVINEIAWMGTTASANDEWVELYNATDTTIDLSGWRLVADDGTPTIEFPQGKSITANGYFLLERTDDTTVSSISADFIYTGALGNSGEILQLYDAGNNLVDLVDNPSTWFNGDNTTKQSMERISVLQPGSSAANWAKNNIIQHNGKDAGTAMYYGTPGNFINGTPKQANSTVTSPTTIDDQDLRFNEFNTIALTFLGSPYLVTGITGITIPVGKTLIVEPGVLLKFLDNRGYLRVQGTLKAQGTQASGITFTVTDLGAIWCGIKVYSTSTASQLDYVTIDKAQSLGGGCNESFITYSMYVESSAVIINNSAIQTGSYYRKLYLKNSNSTINAVTISGATLNADSVGIYIDGGSPTISNSTISNNSIGILVNGLANNPTIQNNTFTGNTYAVKLSSSSAVLSGNTATNNTYNGIFFGGAVLSNMAWQKDSMPYIVNKFTVYAGTTLTIQAGIVVKFINFPSTESEIRVHGSLITQGTGSDPVVFTSAGDNTIGGSNSYSGGGITTSWKRIYIAPGSTGSQLTYTTLRYGGNTYYEAALYVKQSDVQLSNVAISNSTYSGIYSYSGTITGSGVTLSNNTYGFHIQTGDCPALSSVTVNPPGTLLHPSSVACSF